MILTFSILTILGAVFYMVALTKGRAGAKPGLKEWRRFAGALLIILLMGGLVAGTYLFDARTRPTLYVFTWMACGVLVVLAVAVALWDLAEIRHDHRVHHQRNLYLLREDRGDPRNSSFE